MPVRIAFTHSAFLWRSSTTKTVWPELRSSRPPRLGVARTFFTLPWNTIRKVCICLFILPNSIWRPYSRPTPCPLLTPFLLYPCPSCSFPRQIGFRNLVALRKQSLWDYWPATEIISYCLVPGHFARQEKLFRQLANGADRHGTTACKYCKLSGVFHFFHF